MKMFMRSSLLLAFAVLGFSLGSMSSAHAGDMVSMSQMRLADLGYYPGREDGILGQQTRLAIRDFQAYNGLPMTGNLDARTYNLLLGQDYAFYNGGVINGRPAYVRYVAPAAYVQYPAATVTPVAYYGNTYTPQYVPAHDVTRNVVTPVAYYDNGYEHQYVAAPAITPTAYYTQDGEMYTSVAWKY